MKPVPVPQAAAARLIGGAVQDADEQIGIVRIKLALPHCGVGAIVAEFTDADRRLTAWKQARYFSASCHFSILFTDGAAIHGNFQVSEKAKSPLSLARIVLMALGAGVSARGCSANCILFDKGGGPLGADQVQAYSLNQHLHQAKALAERSAQVCIDQDP